MGGFNFFNDDNVASLLLTIAKHEVGDLLDRERIRKSVSFDNLREMDNTDENFNLADSVQKQAINIGPNWAVGRFLQPDEYIKMDELKGIVKREINKISKDDKNYKIFLLNSEGYNYIEIGRMLGLHRQHCVDRMRFIREKFRENKRIKNYVNA